MEQSMRFLDSHTFRRVALADHMTLDVLGGSDNPQLQREPCACTRDGPNPFLSSRDPQPRGPTKDRARLTSHVQVSRQVTLHCAEDRLSMILLGHCSNRFVTSAEDI